MVAVLFLKKDRARPRWRDCVVSQTGPSHVEFNVESLA